jgi:hypothetical protein
MNEWIKISDKLPENQSEVLGLYKKLDDEFVVCHVYFFHLDDGKAPYWGPISQPPLLKMKDLKLLAWCPIPSVKEFEDE